MKVKVSESEGQVLNYLVAQCLGQVSDSARFMAIFTHQNKTKQGYCWSTDWALAGPIIEGEMISIEWTGEDWMAYIYHDQEFFGPTPLIAAMRTYVAYKLGDEVEVPDELAA